MLSFTSLYFCLATLFTSAPLLAASTAVETTLQTAYARPVVNDMENSLNWLTGRNNLTTQSFNVVIAQMGQNYYFPDQIATREWLNQRYAGQLAYNNAGECDGAELTADLISSTNLRVISQVDTINEAERLGIFHKQAWHYNPTSNTYKTIENDRQLNPWDGCWGAALEYADGLQPKLLVPVD